MTQTQQLGRLEPAAPSLTRRWPSALGILAAGGLVAGAWSGHLGWRQLVAVLAAAALVYLGSAALGSRRAAWWLFAGTVLVIGLGGRLDVVDPLVALAACAAALTAVGLVRGWRARGSGTGTRPLLVQLLAALVAVGIAFLAAALTQPWGAALLAAGLLGHTAWDVAHHRSGRVVARSMAEFCAVLDPLLAAGVVALALT